LIKAAQKQLYDSQPLRFLITGGWNTVFSYALLAFMYYTLSEKLHYIVIMVAASVISITNAYICHKFFVFKTKGNYLKEYIRYYVVYAVPLGLSFIFFPFCIEVLRMNFYLTQAILTVITVFISYFGHKHVSFRT